MAQSRGPQSLARTLHTELSSHKGPVNVARYAKGTAKYILTGGQDRMVRLWNAALGTEIKAFTAHGYEVLSITVSVLLNMPFGPVSLNRNSALTIMPNLHLLEGIALFSCGMLQQD